MFVNIATNVFINYMTFLPDICEERHVQLREFCINYLVFVRKKRLQSAIMYNGYGFLHFKDGFL